MRDKWKISLAAGAVVALTATAFIVLRPNLGLVSDTSAATASPEMMAMPVPVQKIVKKAIPIYLDYSARTESIRNVTLQAKVSGYLQEQVVPDGTDVKQGDLLYRIDARDYQAALDQANAQAQRNAAALDYARSNSSRGNELSKNGFLSKDTAEQRTSIVRATEAGLAVDQAAVRMAELNLSYTEICAPFDGRLGRNQAPVGTLVSAAGTALNTVVQLDPIYVTFNLSDTDLIEIQNARAAGKIEAEIRLSGETQTRHKGELTFVDNVVDRLTGTVTARATIANTDRTLLPGQYVRIRLLVREQPDALLVPQTALGSNQLGKYVYVVGEGNKVDQRIVSLGASDGAMVAVLKGVSEGEQVINGNLQKIGPGAVVKPIVQ